MGGKFRERDVDHCKYSRSGDGRAKDGMKMRCPPVPKVVVLWEAHDQHTDRLLRHDGIIITK